MGKNKLRPRLLLIAVLLFLGACAGGPQDFGNRTLVTGRKGQSATYAGKRVPSLQGEVDSGLVVPDGAKGLILLSGSPDKERDEGYVDARELKLRIRELGEQLTADMEEYSLQGSVAMPTSFVDLDDFSRSSPLGRLMAEQLYHELHRRGCQVREYRMPGSIRVKTTQGEFALSRSLGNITAKTPGSVVIVGTYQYAHDAVFVNARLVRPKDGRVLRTASMVLQSNELTRRMARDGKTITKGSMKIRDFRAATCTKPVRPKALSPFDRGEDIH